MDVESVFVPEQIRNIIIREKRVQINGKFFESEHLGNLVGRDRGDRSWQQRGQFQVTD